MSPKLALGFLLAASATLAKGQNNPPDSIRDSYHIFFPAMGKDVLAAHIGDHSYKIVNLYNKPSEVYVDNKLIGEGELSKYNDIIQRIKASVKDDDEAREMREMERDRRQAERDQRQAERDREQEAKDREQHQRDRAQEQIDREQSRRDQEQSRRDHEQSRRDREQSQRDRERIDQDREQSRQGDDGCDDCDDQAEQQQREQSAEDRAMLKKGIQVLVDEHIINNPQSLRTLVLTDTDISVNGIKQSPNVYQEIRAKLGDWARSGLSYGAEGPADNYSLTIND
ncbi:MAG TPA: hypothetical protein VKQ52_19475 [Puia sp.]|nr:hypothetical protein [Puia sp.]